VTAGQFGQDPRPTEEEPDAVARGWVQEADGSRPPRLFVLAKDSLGIGRTETAEPPEWLDLRAVNGLDAIGEPVEGTLEVELSFDDGRSVHAAWPEPFCDRVVATLVSYTQPGAPAPAPAAPAPAAAAPAPGPRAAAPPPGPDLTVPAITAAAASPFAPEASAPVAPEPPGLDLRPDPDAPGAPGSAPAAAPQSAVPTPPPFAAAPPPPVAPPVPAPPNPAPQVPPAVAGVAAAGAATAAADMFAVPSTESPSNEPPAAGPPPAGTDQGGAAVGAPPAGSTALVLEDVVYLGGYPGQTKKRKKCTATLTREGLEVTGPANLSFRVSWDVVRTVETQNADEARFRMNTKVHRDATALVIECQQGVTILLEARDCPTIPLRTAIAQLVADLRVVVV
jgi:hypothetical protein